MPPTGRTGFSARVLGGGDEPDPRFTLASGRTFVAVVLPALGVLLSAGAALRRVGVERSLRHKAALPLPLIAPLLGIGGALASGAVVAFVLQN